MSIVERVRYVKHSDAAIKYAVKLENEKKEFLSLMSLSKIVTKKFFFSDNGSVASRRIKAYKHILYHILYSSFK